MANKKSTLGKVVEAAHGYNIRIMLESKTTEKTGRDGKPVRASFMGDTGKKTQLHLVHFFCFFPLQVFHLCFVYELCPYQDEFSESDQEHPEEA